MINECQEVDPYKWLKRKEKSGQTIDVVPNYTISNSYTYPHLSINRCITIPES